MTVPPSGTPAPDNLAKPATPKPKKSPRKSPKSQAGELVVPAHGAGLIRRGSQPGTNRGGTGRPPNALREQFRDVLGEGGLEFVRTVIQGETTISLTGVCEHCGKKSNGPASADDVLTVAPSVENRLRAVDTAAKYGLGERSEFSEDVVVENVDRMLAAAEAMMSESDYKTYCRHADLIWNPRGSGRNR